MRLLGLALLLLAPVAAAQVPQDGLIETAVAVAIGAPEGHVRPLGEFLSLPIEVTYSYHEVLPAQEPALITLAVAEVPPWFVATISPTSVYGPSAMPPCGCQRQAVLESYLLVSATQDAPGFQPATIAVTATAAPNGPYQGSEGRGEVEVTAGYFGRIDATTPSTTFRMSPGERVERVATVTNFGNAPTRITFQAQESPPGIAVALPAEFDLAARQRGPAENTRSVPITFTAGPTPEPGRVTLRVEGRSTEDPAAEGDTTLLSFAISVPQALGSKNPDWTSRGIPAPGLVAAVAMLGLAALLRRDVV